MKLFLSILFSLNVSVCLFSQNENKNTIELTKSFLNDVLGSVLKNEVVMVNSKISPFTITEIKKSISKKKFSTKYTESGNVIMRTLDLTDEEVQQINFKTNTDNPLWISWLKNTYTNIQILSKELDKKYENREYVYQITQPIFLRNNTICLFYYDYNCGSLCGFGSLTFYTKKNGIWKPYINLYNWTS